jgi:hypothetical protein
MANITFKEYLLEQAETENMSIDQDFVERTPQLKSKTNLLRTNPAEFQRLYRQAVRRDPEQKRIEQMKKTAVDRVTSAGGSRQEVGARA